jgi:hypothetical protein
MTTVQKLLVDALVTTATVAGGKFGRDNEAVMVLLLLPGSGLVTIQAVHTLPGVGAHLVLVYNGILAPGVALGAFAGRTYESSIGLLGFNSGARAVQQEGGNYQGEGDYNGNKYGPKGHRKPQGNLSLNAGDRAANSGARIRGAIVIQIEGGNSQRGEGEQTFETIGRAAGKVEESSRPSETRPALRQGQWRYERTRSRPLSGSREAAIITAPDVSIRPLPRNRREFHHPDV